MWSLYDTVDDTVSVLHRNDTKIIRVLGGYYDYDLYYGTVDDTERIQNTDQFMAIKCIKIYGIHAIYKTNEGIIWHKN